MSVMVAPVVLAMLRVRGPIAVWLASGLLYVVTRPIWYPELFARLSHGAEVSAAIGAAVCGGLVSS